MILCQVFQKVVKVLQFHKYESVTVESIITDVAIEFVFNIRLIMLSNIY